MDTFLTFYVLNITNRNVNLQNKTAKISNIKKLNNKKTAAYDTRSTSLI